MITRRQFRGVTTAALALLASQFLMPPEAHALVVEDVAGILQVIAQYSETAQQVLTTQRQVEQLRAAARQLDPRSYRSVQNLLSGNDVNFLALTRDLQSMGYSIRRVNQRFQRLFPDERAVSTMRPKEFRESSRAMNKEVHDSALAAARAQTTLRTIEQNDLEARNILSRSEGNGSQVAQLQSALQMLALIHQNLVSITQTIATAGRVSSNIAARDVTERRIDRERQLRLMRDYNQRSSSPPIDSRFLQEGSW